MAAPNLNAMTLQPLAACYLRKTRFSHSPSQCQLCPIRLLHSALPLLTKCKLRRKLATWGNKKVTAKDTTNRYFGLDYRSSPMPPLKHHGLSSSMDRDAVQGQMVVPGSRHRKCGSGPALCGAPLAAAAGTATYAMILELVDLGFSRFAALRGSCSSRGIYSYLVFGLPPPPPHTAQSDVCKSPGQHLPYWVWSLEFAPCKYSTRLFSFR